MLKEKIKEANLGKGVIFFAVLYAIGVILSFSGVRDYYLEFSVGSALVDLLLVLSVAVKNWLWVLSIMGLAGLVLGCKYELSKEQKVFKLVYLVVFIIGVVGFAISSVM